LHNIGAGFSAGGQIMTFVSRWFKTDEGKNARRGAPAPAAGSFANRDSRVAFVAGEGARVYSLDAFRTLKKLPDSRPDTAA
jgi:hypothetical protein